MKKELQGYCKELNGLFIILAVLLTMAMLWAIFGWGDAVRTSLHQTGRTVESLKPPEKPEVEREVVVQRSRRQVQGANWGFPDATAIGIKIVDIDLLNKDALGLKNSDGVVVSSIASDSMAFQAGLRENDVIYRINNHKVENIDDYQHIEKTFVEGRRYKFRIIRKKRKRAINLLYKTNPTQLVVLNKNQTQTSGPSQSWMGLGVQNIDALIQKQFNLANSKGAIVSFIEKNSPAEMAGIHQGDVIYQLAGKPVNHITTIKDIMLTHQPGDQLEVVVHRGQEEIRLLATLAYRPVATKKKPVVLPKASVETEATWIGLTLEPLTRQEALELNLPQDSFGMIVNDIQKGPAAKSGLVVGDVIIGVNGKSINDLRDFNDLTAKAQGALLDILRDGKHVYITIPEPKQNKMAKKGGLFQVGLHYKKILLSSSGETLFDQIYPYFEKAPFFIIYDINRGDFEVRKNPAQGIELNERRIILINFLIENMVASVITGEMDRFVHEQIVSEHINVYSGVFGNINNATTMYLGNRLVSSN